MTGVRKSSPTRLGELLRGYLKAAGLAERELPASVALVYGDRRGAIGLGGAGEGVADARASAELERLRAQAREQFMREQDKLEQRELDERSTLAFARREGVRR